MGLLNTKWEGGQAQRPAVSRHGRPAPRENKYRATGSDGSAGARRDYTCVRERVQGGCQERCHIKLDGGACAAAL